MTLEAFLGLTVSCEGRLTFQSGSGLRAKANCGVPGSNAVGLSTQSARSSLPWQLKAKLIDGSEPTTSEVWVHAIGKRPHPHLGQGKTLAKTQPRSSAPNVPNKEKPCWCRVSKQRAARSKEKMI